MKNLQIQNEMLKAIGKQKVAKYEKQDDDVMITFDDCVVYIIPKDEFYINFLFMDSVDILYVFDGEGEDAIFTGDVKIVRNELILKLANENTCAWFKQKYLKYFDKNATFKITGKTNPIHVYEDNKLVGCILPSTMTP